MGAPYLVRPLLATWLVVGFAAHAGSGVPARLKIATDCMFSVLKAVPGVSEVAQGVETNEGWPHTFLEYRATEGSSSLQPIRFHAQKSDRGGYWFLAVRSGFDVDLHVTDVVMKKWKSECSVDSNVLFP